MIKNNVSILHIWNNGVYCFEKEKEYTNLIKKIGKSHRTLVIINGLSKDELELLVSQELSSS